MAKKKKKKKDKERKKKVPKKNRLAIPEEEGFSANPLGRGLNCLKLVRK